MKFLDGIENIEELDELAQEQFQRIEIMRGAIVFILNQLKKNIDIDESDLEIYESFLTVLQYEKREEE